MIDLKNKRFGRLVIKSFAGFKIIGNRRNRVWCCICDCGNEINVLARSLKSGNTKSCGCLSIEKSRIRAKNNFTIHGKTKTRLYKIWSKMRERCDKKYYIKFKNYGGRGIKVCSEWQKFIPFYNWAMENGYKENLTIDRKDVNGNYDPDNCRWATTKQQGNNKRNNHVVEYRGKTMTITQWNDLLGFKKGIFSLRIRRGMCIEKAITKRIREIKGVNDNEQLNNKRKLSKGSRIAIYKFGQSSRFLYRCS